MIEPVARVLRANTKRFSAGTRLNRLSGPAFGSLVKAVGYFNPTEVVYGLITDIHIDDDPLVRQMILADSISEEMLKDQREHRMAPVELDILAVGYLSQDNRIMQMLPPRPPMGLDPVHLCDAEEVLAFSQNFTFFQLILGAGDDLPLEQLLSAFLRQAASLIPEANQRYSYLVNAGREAARLWGRDMKQIENLLSLIKGW